MKLSPKLAIFLIFSFLSLSCPVLAQGRLDRPTFFQDGQRLMDQEIQRLQQQQTQQQQDAGAIEHPSQLLTIDEGQLRWQKYIFQAGGFSVWMPQGIVQSQESVTLDLPEGKLAFEVFSTQPKSYRFVAAYSDPLTPDQLVNPSTLLASVREGIITRTNFTPISDRSLTGEQYPGLELIMKDGSEIIGFRLYLIEQRVYVLAAGQKNTDTLSTDANSFFESFRLLK